MTRLKYLTLGFSLILFSGASQAALISISSLTAEWINPMGGGSTVNITGPGPSATIYWGNDAGHGQSGYHFDTEATPIDNEVPPSTGDFLLGNWTHYNNPIYAPTLESVTLKLTADIDANGSFLGSFDFFYDFMHFETPNNADPCANGDDNGEGVNINGCGDIVDVIFNDLSESFEIDGALFTLNLVPSSSYFETIEKDDNTFQVFANITAVPTPSSVFLLGLGLIGLGFAHRRLHNK